MSELSRGHPDAGEQPRPLCMIGRFDYGGLKLNNGVFYSLRILLR